jgi:alanyl-tRNA synthetase
VGTHVQQRGSLVAPDRFRFDFSHTQATSKEELSKVQEMVNEAIRQNLKVASREVSYTEAIAEGAMALFGEKYGDRVRLVQVTGANCSNPERTYSKKPISSELCGGTHVSATGDLGFFLITAETSVGAGLRRIEGMTGGPAEKLIASYVGTLQSVAERLKAPLEEAGPKLDSLLQNADADRKRIAQLERALWRHGADTLAARATMIGDVAVLAERVDASSVNALRDAGDALREKISRGVIALGAVVEDRPQFLVIVSPDLIPRGLHAGNIAKEVAKIAGGGGGGKPVMAQAGGKDKSKLDEAISQVRLLVERTVNK